MTKILNVIVRTISNSQVFLLKKMGAAFANIFFSKHFSVYAVFNDKKN